MRIRLVLRGAYPFSSCKKPVWKLPPYSLSTTFHSLSSRLTVLAFSCGATLAAPIRYACRRFFCSAGISSIRFTANARSSGFRLTASCKYKCRLVCCHFGKDVTWVSMTPTRLSCRRIGRTSLLCSLLTSPLLISGAFSFLSKVRVIAGMALPTPLQLAQLL